MANSPTQLNISLGHKFPEPIANNENMFRKKRSEATSKAHYMADEDPVKQEVLSSDIELLNFRAIKRVCRL